MFLEKINRLGPTEVYSTSQKLILLEDCLSRIVISSSFFLLLKIMSEFYMVPALEVS